MLWNCLLADRVKLLLLLRRSHLTLDNHLLRDYRGLLPDDLLLWDVNLLGNLLLDLLGDLLDEDLLLRRN